MKHEWGLSYWPLNLLLMRMVFARSSILFSFRSCFRFSFSCGKKVRLTNRLLSRKKEVDAPTFPYLVSIAYWESCENRPRPGPSFSSVSSIRVKPSPTWSMTGAESERYPFWLQAWSLLYLRAPYGIHDTFIYVDSCLAIGRSNALSFSFMDAYQWGPSYHSIRPEK